MKTKSFSILMLLMVALLFTFVGCKKPGGTGESPNPKEKEDIVTHKDLLIEEVFYAGSLKNGKWPYVYEDDIYFKIHNPTKETLYLDGVFVASSGFSPDSKLNLNADEGKQHKGFAAGGLAQFPGTGNEYAIAPSESVLIAATAANHSVEDPSAYHNPDSFDLSEAKFEYAPTASGRKDNPKVPNLIPIFRNGDFSDDLMARSLLPKKSGVLALIRPDKMISDAKSVLNTEKYIWKGSYVEDGHEHTFDIKVIYLPNEWVIDVVAICPQGAFDWYVVDRSLEKSHTSVALDSKAKDTTYAGKALFRKNEGRGLVDTNDSAKDFEVKVASKIVKK